jgi:hypothetical protein
MRARFSHVSRWARTHRLRTGKRVFRKPGERSTVVGIKARGKVWHLRRWPVPSRVDEPSPVVRLL